MFRFAVLSRLRAMPIVDLIQKLQRDAVDSAALTEADCRAQIIDPLLRELGWLDSQVHREPYAGWADDRGYIDYLLAINHKSFMVIEAKKTGRSFDIPAALTPSGETSYEKLYATSSKDLHEALGQCLRYATHCGASFACATNGKDFVIFKTHHDGRGLPQAKVIIFRGLQDVLARIDEFVELLSRADCEKARIDKLLVGREMVAPTHARRLSQSVLAPGGQSPESIEYSRVLDYIVRNYILELKDDDTFLRCYIDIELNQTTDAALGALISNQETQVEGATSTDQFAAQFSQQLGFPDAPAGKTVILHGPIGVGKSSLLRVLQKRISAKGKTLWVVVDLIDFKDHPFDARAASEMAALLSVRVRNKVADAAQSLGKNADPDEWNHLRDIYNAEVRRFQKGKFPESDDSDELFMREARNYVWELRESDPQDHLVRTLRWLTGHCAIPVVLVLDNTDQLGLDFQEFLFKLSEGIQSNTSAITMISLRTEALVSHRLRDHALATVMEKYAVTRPPLLAVLRRRLEVVLERIHTLRKAGESYRIASERFEALIDTLLDEAVDGGENSSLLEAVGNGNLRRALEAVANVFRPDQKILDSLVADRARHKHATLPVRYVRRSILVGKSGRYEGDNPDCLVPNIFQGEIALRTPQTLALRLLQHLEYRQFGGEPLNVIRVCSDFALAGMDYEYVKRLVVRMRALGLLMVAHMNNDIGDDDVLKVTLLGTSMLRDWYRDAEYLKATAFDTVIYEEEPYIKMANAWRDGRIPRSSRFAIIENAFVNYLEQEDAMLLKGLSLDLLSPVVREPLRFRSPPSPGHGHHKRSEPPIPRPGDSRRRR
jgi:hypothetical protein